MKPGDFLLHKVLLEAVGHKYIMKLLADGCITGYIDCPFGLEPGQPGYLKIRPRDKPLYESIAIMPTPGNLIRLLLSPEFILFDETGGRVFTDIPDLNRPFRACFLIRGGVITAIRLKTELPDLPADCKMRVDP